MTTETDLQVWVRAVDGALYRDPVVVVEGGFVSFPPGLAARSPGRALAHLWVAEDGAPARSLERVLGDALSGGWREPLDLGLHERVAVPAANLSEVDRNLPRPVAPAIAYTVQPTRRVAVPQIHGGATRYASRLKRHVVLDFGGDDAAA